MDYDSLLELLKKRRTVRKFKPDPIPDDYIDKIIEAARWAPSGANSQPWEFVVIKKQELRDKINELMSEYHNIMRKTEAVREPDLKFKWIAAGYFRAPVFILVCGDTRTKEAYPLNALLDSGSSIFTSSLANAFLNMQLAVTTLGLGAQWVTAISSPAVQVLTKDLLGIPKELVVYDMLAVGFPDTEIKPRLVREREEMVHRDYYDRSRFRTQQQINDFIAALRGRQK